MSVSCSCMDKLLVFLKLILLTRFSQRGSLLSGGGQWAHHVHRGCSRLISISRRWGWARHLPGGWADGGPWSTVRKWTQRRAAPAHAPIPDLICNAECGIGFSYLYFISLYRSLHVHSHFPLCVSDSHGFFQTVHLVNLSPHIHHK